MKKYLGNYEIVAEIGRGGMGVVYKGYEPALARYVAIKELSPMLAHDPVVVERFLREARSMAALNDPHIIQIYSIGQEDNEPFFVMEFVDGVSIATLLKRDGHLQTDDALKIVLETARGLSAAHDRGDMSAKLTSAGDVVGTAAYLSPEVMQGNPVDARSEIYAVGIVLFEMLAGRTPFSESNVYKLMHDVVETQAPDVRDFNQGIDADIVAILARMLAKDPAERYQSMHELIADLKQHPLITGGGPIRVAIPPPAGTTGTMVGLATPMTPGSSRPRVTTPPPDAGKRPSTNTPAVTSIIQPTTPSGPANSERTSDSPGAPGLSTKSRWSPLILSLLMFLAGATWALRGQLSEMFGAATHAPATTTSAPASSPSTATTQEARKTPVAAYVEASIVTLLGLAAMGFWFGVHRRRRVEIEAGIHSLANMKWRDCIGLTLEVLGRDGYKEEPGFKPTGDGGTEFLLLRGDERVLLGFKLGTAYRIGETSVREFAKGLEAQGATRGILLTLGSIEDSVRDLAKRHAVDLIDGATIWPRVRPFIPANILDHVRLQVATQTRNGFWIGFASSVLLGMATFLFASQSSPEAIVPNVAATVAAEPPAVAARPPVNAAAVMQNVATAQAKRAEIAALTDAQRIARRAKAASQVSMIAQVAHAAWPTESTLELSLKQTDGVDANLIAEVCKVLAQYEEIRLTRLQIDPVGDSNGTVRWGQCQ
jgi:serine/threonine protein kinase